MKPSSYPLLGVKVHPLSIPELNNLIAEAVKTEQQWVIANHNMHSIYIYHHDAEMRRFYEKADFVHIDGMALVLLGRLLGLPLEREQRVTYVDWTPALMEAAAQNGWRVFYLGSKPGVAERGAQILRQRYPGLAIAVAHGYFDAHPESPENQAVLAQIKDFRPTILMVGMSMPRQEHWIAANRHQLPVNAILTSGAAIDYVAGAVPTPPRWAGQMGIEWLFRLLAEPKRMWRRYLVEPWFLMRWALTQRFNAN